MRFNWKKWAILAMFTGLSACSTSPKSPVQGLTGYERISVARADVPEDRVEIRPDARAEIRVGAAYTVLAVVTVKPGQQDKVLELEARHFQQAKKGVSGFLAASVHRGLDGKRVLDYLQFQNEGAYLAWRNGEAHRKHLAGLMEFIVKVEMEAMDVASIQ